MMILSFVFLILGQVHFARLSSKGLTVTSRYSTVVVFGDSYSDDEHRPTEPAGNPYEALSRIGANSTGILWPNILVREMSPANPLKLYDYSYNGAHANNQLTNFGLDIPDTRAQIQQYLSDVESGKIASGKGEILYIWWVGINPIDAIWINTCNSTTAGSANARYPTDPQFIDATERITKQVDEVQSQVAYLRANVMANMQSASYMVITVPNVGLAPLQKLYVQQWAKDDKVRQKDVLKLLKLLIEQYNKGIRKAIDVIRIGYGEARGFIRTYDIAPLWASIIRDPGAYGIKNVTGSCFVDNVVCANVSDYFFWDYLHTSPLAESIFSHDMKKFILAQP